MSNINVFIKDNIEKIGSDVYITPEIPEKKLNNAIKAFKCENFYQSILAIQDATVFGSSKEGFVFTGEKMIHHKFGEFIYSDINSVEYLEEVQIDKKGKENKNKKLIINRNEEKIDLGYLGGINKKNFSNFLNEIINNFDDYKEENQLKVISEMSEELRVSYVKIIVNMTFSDDGEIDRKELSEIYSLMTRLELSTKSRFLAINYVNSISADKIQKVEDLVATIRNESEVSHHRSLFISLVKDLINVYFSTNEDKEREFPFLSQHKACFAVSDAEVDLAYQTVENDHKLLDDDLDDTVIKKNLKELTSKAAAAGAPLAAVYISGSVIGMSAAGITSGLATLGMGMGMTGGVAVLGLIGVFSYRGVKHLTGASELDKYKTRDLMLHEVIKQTQKTTSLMISDMNHIVKMLNDTIKNHSDQKGKIRKLTLMMAQYQGALSNVDSKSNLYQNSANRLQNPKILDNARLESLTSEVRLKPLYEFLVSNYEIKNTNSEGEKYYLKADIDTEVLDKMAEIFNTLRYFEVDNIMKSKASGLLKGVL